MVDTPRNDERTVAVYSSPFLEQYIMVDSLNRRTLVKFLCAGAGTTLLGACGSDSDPRLAINAQGQTNPASNRTIVELAQATPELSVLVEAVVAAGLVNTLSQGQLTVFAPTNEAFANLLLELNLTKQQLFADRTLLTAVLNYHVLGNRQAIDTLPQGRAILTASGGVFRLGSSAGRLRINDGRNRVSTLVTTNINARNGIVHIVDRVLLPANRDVVDTALNTPDLSILAEAVVAAGLVNILRGRGPFTVFAPTNAAFNALLLELGLSKQALLSNVPLLTQVLTYHVLGQRLLAAELPVNRALSSVQGQSFQLDTRSQIIDQQRRVTRLLGTDVLTSNGVVHVIDRVLLPRL